MSKTRPPYPRAFRQQMFELVRAGRSPEELGREFEPSAQAIRNRVVQADRDDGRRSDGVTSTERAELHRLRRENRQLRQDPRMRADRPAALPVSPRGPQRGLRVHPGLVQSAPTALGHRLPVTAAIRKKPSATPRSPKSRNRPRIRSNSSPRDRAARPGAAGMRRTAAPTSLPRLLGSGPSKGSAPIDGTSPAS